MAKAVNRSILDGDYFWGHRKHTFYSTNSISTTGVLTIVQPSS
jgi:hypothetical protein